MFRISNEGYACDSICGVTIDQGTTVCVAAYCRVNHRSGGNKMAFEKGQIFILKARIFVFCTPCVSGYDIDDDVINVWLNQSHTFN